MKARSSSPISMLANPATRNWVSVSSLMLCSARRNAWGLANGKMPSSTSKSAKAAPSSRHISSFHDVALRSSARRLFHIFEKVGARIDDQDIVLLFEAFLVG